MNGCDVAGCDRSPRTRGWCQKHYQRWINCGDPLGRQLTYYPLEPLYAAANVTTRGALAERVGVERRTVARWATAGLTEYAADRAAIAIGSHPGTVWPDLWYTA